MDFAKLRQRGKKDQPLKLLWDIKMVLKRRFFLFLFLFCFLFFFMPTTLYLTEKKKGMA